MSPSNDVAADMAPRVNPTLPARPSTSAVREWRDGWPIVLAGFFGNVLLNMAIMSFGTFMAPLNEAFGWSRTELSMGFTVMSIVGIIFAPIVGVLVDKYGARRVALPGIILVGCAFASFGTLNGSITYWLFLWLVFGCVNSLVMLTVWYHAITSAFRVSRGLALSVNSTGGGIAAMCGPIAANFLIEVQGWRMAFIVMGLGCACFVAALCYFALRERVGSHLSSNHDERPTGDQPVIAGVTVSEGLRSFAFAKIMTAIFFAYLLSTCLTVHQISILTDGGVPRDTAVATAGAYGVALIIGKISSGIAVDRFPARFVGAICLTLFLICFAILRFPGEAITSRVVAISLFGLSTGGLAPLIPNLISRYFGLRSFGRLFGAGVSIISIAGALGPLFGGVIYDTFKSYNLLLSLAMPMLFLGVIFLLSLGEYPAFSNEHADPVG